MSTPAKPVDAKEVTRLQNWFQAVITHAEGVEAGLVSEDARRLFELGPGELEKIITRSKALTAAERLAIYANAYHSRLLECLGEVYPMLKRTLGEAAFDGLAFGYLQEYPSRSYTLNELGRHFPGYLERTRPLEEQSDMMQDWPGFLIDLARLEWAIYEVFDGPGVEGGALLNADQLIGISPEQWPGMQLNTVVCLQLLKTKFPVNDYFTALRQAAVEEPPPIPEACESFLALTRREWVVRRHPLSKMQFDLLSALKAGQSIGQALESIAPTNPADLDQLAANLQAWFRNWTLNGFFQSVASGS